MQVKRKRTLTRGNVALNKYYIKYLNIQSMYININININNIIIVHMCIQTALGHWPNKALSP